MGKPLAGQLGQPQMGGGFGGSQPQLRQPALQSPYNGRGGGYQPPRQRFNQMPQQMPMFGPGGSSRDFYTRQMPQMPQQQMFQQQMPQMFQQQMPQMPQAQRDEYNRLSAMSPEQRFSTLINQMGPEERGQYNAGIQQAAQDPSTQRQYDAFRSGQGQNMDPNLVRAIEGFRSSAPQQSGFGGQPQMPMMPQPMMPMMPPPPLMRDSGPMPAVPYSQRQPQMQQTDPMRQAIQSGIRNGQFSPRALSRADMLGRLSEMTTVNSGAPTPQAPAAMIGAPQTDPRFRDGGAVTEDPRMQAMRGIQQLANRQRGFR